MTNLREERGGRIHTVQPERDLEANWEVDLSVKLEEYLLKICSGEITGNAGEDDHITVNFAEAALLLQGSVQVYSRKVEYLYNLVLHTLEFLSKQRQQDPSEGTSVQAEESCSHQASEDENDLFWNLDDIPVEPKNCIDSSTGKDSFLNHFVKPPANLVVLEGDCLDSTGDGGELESYLLATTHLYRDFILLDPCDAVAVNEFLGGNESGKGKSSAYRGSSARKSFQSPVGRSGGTAHKSSLGKNQNANSNLSPRFGGEYDANNYNKGHGNFGDGHHEFNMDDGDAEPMNVNDGDSDDDDDDDDPWKPLNPYEPGSLKVKPFRKVKAFRKNRTNFAKDSVTTMFPLAKAHGIISPELTDMWERRHNACEKVKESQYLPCYEKLRQSLINGENKTSDASGSNGEDDTDDDPNDGPFHDFGQQDGDLPQNMYMDEDSRINANDDGGVKFHNDEAAFENGEPYSQANLEDLCRSHLDALLASIAETEKQTELAARVSSWKQKIEQNLEEQDSRPPFDIHDYGERIIDKLSLEEDGGNVMSFADVVRGQEKHDIARAFSALLQLVNNGDVDLDKSGYGRESVCYTSVNPFHVRLLSKKSRNEEQRLRQSRKRAKSQTKDASTRGDSDFSGKKPNTGSSNRNRKISMKLSKINGIRCTPDAKKRRKSGLVEPLDLSSAR